MILGLDAFVFKKAACGAYHTIAVNEWGQLFSWGSNSEGQLGNDIYYYKHYISKFPITILLRTYILSLL